MDKQPKLIDAEKVFDWANDNISTVDFARLHQAFKNGEFDPIPPTIKQGDKVRHKIEGLGTVKKICEDEAIVYFGGLAVRCKIEDLEAYSHD